MDFTDLDVAIAEDDDAVLAVSEALDLLTKLDPVAAELIKKYGTGSKTDEE